MNIIFLGLQGSGKGTQAKLLAQYLNLPVFNTGALFRKKREEYTPLGRKIKKLIDAGNRVPDGVTIKLANRELEKPEYKNGAVIDGVPRTLRQAKGLAVRADKVFYLKISRKEGKRRLLKRARHDDTPEAIKKRFGWYYENIEPILEYYREQSVLVEIDGERSVEEISKEVKRKVS